MADHGLFVTEGAVTPPPIGLPDVSNIGIIGTAPGADPGGKFGENGKIKYNHPFLVTSRADIEDIGAQGTLPDAFRGIFDQTRARIVFSIIEEIPTGAAIAAFTRSAHLTGHNTAADIYINVDGGEMIIGSNASDTSGNRAALEGLVIGQKISISPPSVTTKGIYRVTGPVTQGNNVLNIPVEQEIAEKPTIANDNTITIEVAEQDGDAETRSNAVGNAIEGTGVYSLLNAESVTGVRPNIIMATGLGTGAQVGGNKNPLGAALEAAADRLRGIALIAGPNTTHDEAIAWADEYGSDRVYLIDPHVRVHKGLEIVDQDPTAHIAGVIVKNDAEEQAGWSNSPSNRLINGILGTSRPIDYVAGDTASRASLLNAAGIATIINLDGGYRLWGNLTAATGDREHWKFINVRRVSDVLYKAIQDEHLWAVDKGITPTYFEAVSEGVNALIRTLKNQNALIEGSCYPDQDLNSAANIANGKVFFNVEYTPVYPAQSVNFNVQLNTQPLDNII